MDEEKEATAMVYIQAAARIIIRASMDAIYRDPHQWSTRPCQTCRAVSVIIGEPFGCSRYAIERKGKGDN